MILLWDNAAGAETHRIALGTDVATLATGGSSFVVLSPDEVKKLRGGRVGTSGQIADPMKWMERKTVLRQLVKTLPRSTMLNHALTSDEQMGSSLRSQRAAEQITSGAVVDETTGEVIDEEPTNG